MTRRRRKLIGAIVMIVFVLAYGPLAMALAESRIMAAPQPVQVLAYLVLGLAWILPLLPLIRWMERPDERSPSSARKAEPRNR
jgi:multisubunit Na+/H+ antiporter MnhB subunit